MLKTNSKKAKENLRNYIIENVLHNNETECTTIDEAAATLKKHFNVEKLHPYNLQLIRSGKTTEKTIFKSWLQGLPHGGIGDYWYFCNAADILGSILEETEEEKARFTEEEAANMLTTLIYNEIFH